MVTVESYGLDSFVARMERNHEWSQQTCARVAQAMRAATRSHTLLLPVAGNMFYMGAVGLPCILALALLWSTGAEPPCFACGVQSNTGCKRQLKRCWQVIYVLVVAYVVFVIYDTASHIDFVYSIWGALLGMLVFWFFCGIGAMEAIRGRARVAEKVAPRRRLQLHGRAVSHGEHVREVRPGPVDATETTRDACQRSARRSEDGAGREEDG